MSIYFTCLVLLLVWTFYYFVLPLIGKKYQKKHPGKQPTASPKKNYLSGTFPILCFAVLCFISAYEHQLPVFGKFRINISLSLMAIGFLALNMFLEHLEWKFTPVKAKQRWIAIFPRTTKERLLWIPASLIVAVSEEIIYRAVFFGLILEITGDYWIAGIASALLFAMAHLRYGLLGASTCIYVAIVLQYFVVISGGLYIAIAVHFVHNFMNGLAIGAVVNRKTEGEIIQSLAHIFRIDTWRNTTGT